METSDGMVTSDQEEFVKRHNSSQIQTLITGVWQSDPQEFFEISRILNAWFAIADDHPEIIVSQWQVIPLDTGMYSVLVELMLPSQWKDKLYETDLSWLGTSGRR